MADQKGTGKHPHKSTEEPYPHHEAQGGGKPGGSSQQSRGSSQNESGSESSDLKEREYRDAQGNIRHHTRTSKEEKNK
jgi:hypothetical protein